MNKAAYKQQIKGIDHAIEWHTEELKAWQRVKTEAELTQAEAEKPKLRHGDYGLLCGSPYFVNVDHSLHSKENRPFGISHSGGQSNFDQFVQEFQCLGNIFDDLKALSEPLKEFKTDYACETTIWELSPTCKDLIVSRNGKKEVMVRKQDIPELILNLGRLVATAEKHSK